jgi:hypothetical protein
MKMNDQLEPTVYVIFGGAGELDLEETRAGLV